MLVDVVLPVLVGASAIVVATAATYAAGRVAQAADTIEAADRRSRENRGILTGERDGTKGVLPWLQELDEEVHSDG